MAANSIVSGPIWQKFKFMQHIMHVNHDLKVLYNLRRGKAGGGGGGRGVNQECKVLYN